MIWRVRPDFWKSKRFEESRFINQKSEPCKSKLYNMLVQDPHQNKSGAGVFVFACLQVDSVDLSSEF